MSKKKCDKRSGIAYVVEPRTAAGRSHGDLLGHSSPPTGLGVTLANYGGADDAMEGIVEENDEATPSPLTSVEPELLPPAQSEFFRLASPFFYPNNSPSSPRLVVAQDHEAVDITTAEPLASPFILKSVSLPSILHEVNIQQDVDAMASAAIEDHVPLIYPIDPDSASTAADHPEFLAICTDSCSVASPRAEIVVPKVEIEDFQIELGDLDIGPPLENGQNHHVRRGVSRTVCLRQLCPHILDSLSPRSFRARRSVVVAIKNIGQGHP